MPYSISTLLTRNLQDVFGENDPKRRRTAIDELWHEDGVFYDPSNGAYRGRDQGYSPRFSISTNCRSRGIGQWRAGQMGVGPPW